jgi:hypothetical protein
MRLFVFASVLALVASGCALRPRYADFVNAKFEGKEVTFLLVDADTNRPVPGAKVEFSELKNRVTVTTAADGTFKAPLDKKYVDENPVFVVTLPKGTSQYRMTLVHEALPPPTMPEPAVEAVDAGMPASNG